MRRPPFPQEMAPFVDAVVDETSAVRLHRRVDQPGGAPLGGDRPPCALHREPAPPGRARRRTGRAPATCSSGVREAFDRSGGRRPRRAARRSTGVDAVRPVTFGYLPVLCRPADESRVAATRRRAAHGRCTRRRPRTRRLRDDLIQRVIEAKLRRLADIDRDTASAARVGVGDALSTSCRSTTR